jgi:hypothetical protein
MTLTLLLFCWAVTSFIIWYGPCQSIIRSKGKKRKILAHSIKGISLCLWNLEGTLPMVSKWPYWLWGNYVKGQGHSKTCVKFLSDQHELVVVFLYFSIELCYSTCHNSLKLESIMLRHAELLFRYLWRMLQLLCIVCLCAV